MVDALSSSFGISNPDTVKTSGTTSAQPAPKEPPALSQVMMAAFAQGMATAGQISDVSYIGGTLAPPALSGTGGAPQAAPAVEATDKKDEESGGIKINVGEDPKKAE